jgi:hypothetical protein
MTHNEGASDTLAAIRGRLDRMDIRFNFMDTKLDGIHDAVQWQGEMLKFHGLHFGRLEAILVEHGDMLKAQGGMLKAHDRRFDQIDATLAEHGHRFDQIDDRFGQIDDRFGQIDDRFGQIDDRFGQVDEMLGKILARLDAPRP